VSLQRNLSGDRLKTVVEAPSVAYLATLANGPRESEGLGDPDILHYLAGIERGPRSSGSGWQTELTGLRPPSDAIHRSSTRRHEPIFQVDKY